MSTIVDHLITKYTLDAKGYQDGAKRVTGATQGLASKIGALAGTASALSVTGLVAFAVNSAVSFDTLTRSLTAVTKSGERASQVLGFVDKLAIPSVFDSEALAQAATTLEAFGLKTEKWLPIVEKLGTVFGGTSGDLMQFVNAIGMIKAGRAGEGLEALGRAGVSRDALKLRGIEFDKGGSLKSEIGALMQAVEAEVNQRFGNLGEVMGGGAAAKFASFTDAMKRGMRDVGNAILGFVLPYVERLSSWIQDLTASGQMQRFGEQIVATFEKVGTVLGFAWNILQKIPTPILVIAGSLAALKPILIGLGPLINNIGIAMVNAARQGASAFLAMSLKVSAAFAAIAFAQYIADGLKEVIRRKELQSEAEGMVPAFKVDDQGKFVRDKDGNYVQFSDAERAEEIKKNKRKILERRFENDTGLSLGSGGEADQPPIQKEQLSVLRKIEQNTDRTNQLFAYVFSQGGSLYTTGVPIREFSQGGGGRGGGTMRTLKQIHSMGTVLGA